MYPRGVDEDDLGSAGPETSGGRPARLISSAVSDVVSAVRNLAFGEAGVQQGVAAAGLEDGEKRHHHLQGPLQVDADHRSGLNPRVHEVTGQAVGPAVEFRVGEGVAAVDESDGVRSGPRLLFEEFVQRLVPGDVDVLPVPGNRHVPAVGGCQQAAHPRAVGCPHSRFEEGHRRVR